MLDLAQLLLIQNLSGDEEAADYSAFILDKLAEVLDPDDRPFERVDITFYRQAHLEERQNQFQKIKKHRHLTAQYAIHVTPTFHRFAPAIHQEGNHMLRQYKEDTYHFIRI